MATIQTRKGKKGITYRVEYMRDGFRVSKSFKLKKDAQKFSASLLVDDSFSHALTNHTLNNLTLSHATEMYLQQNTGKDPSKKQRLGYWCNLFGNKTVGKVTRQQVRAELKAMIASGKSPATANRYKASLGALYTYLTAEFDIDYSPVKGIAQFEENNARTRFLSNAEISLLLSASKESQWERLYLLVLMAITTGARRTELLTLDWTNINLKARTAHIKQSKNGEQRILTLTQDVICELMKFREHSGFIFPHSKNACGYFKVFDYHWKEALSKAGIIDFRFHDLRHTCASLLAMNGASLVEIAHVLGHKSITMTQRYSHLCTEHKAQLTDRVFGELAHG